LIEDGRDWTEKCGFQVVLLWLIAKTESEHGYDEDEMSLYKYSPYSLSILTHVMGYDEDDGLT
jgi:hypothetical protein